MRLLIVRNLSLVLLVALLTGCASFSRGLPGVTNPPSREAEAKLVEASGALDSVNEQSAAFYSQLAQVASEVKEFCGRPSWPEFEQILLEFPSLRDPDNDIEITSEIESRFSDWARRWKSSWEETFTAYHDLVDKCIILEARRLAVRERLLAVQAKYIAAVMLEISAGREKQAQEIYTVVDVLDKSGAELNSYQVDDLGFFRLR
ncbi:MAG: hypothetical protein ABFD97_05775 [Syntrophobacter sp.]